MPRHYNPLNSDHPQESPRNRKVHKNFKKEPKVDEQKNFRVITILMVISGAVAFTFLLITGEPVQGLMTSNYGVLYDIGVFLMSVPAVISSIWAGLRKKVPGYFESLWSIAMMWIVFDNCKPLAVWWRAAIAFVSIVSAFGLGQILRNRKIQKGGVNA
jgi:hypothetical protein